MGDLNVRLFLFFAVLLSGLVGCSAGRMDLVDNGAICIDLEAPVGVSLKSVKVYREKEGLVIEGLVVGSYPGVREVTLELIDPIGSALDVQIVPIQKGSRHTTKNHFRATFGHASPTASRLRISL